jgi:hypothetical protein
MHVLEANRGIGVSPQLLRFDLESRCARSWLGVAGAQAAFGVWAALTPGPKHVLGAEYPPCTSASGQGTSRQKKNRHAGGKKQKHHGLPLHASQQYMHIEDKRSKLLQGRTFQPILWSTGADLPPWAGGGRQGGGRRRSAVARAETGTSDWLSRRPKLGPRNCTKKKNIHVREAKTTDKAVFFSGRGWSVCFSCLASGCSR